MRKGINRALLSSQNRGLYENATLQSSKCVFISHKSEDIEVAKEIAALLQNDGIDVYLDTNDFGLQRATREGNASKIVECIERALSVSTHILVLVTDKTKESWWVPYEVGFSKKGKKQIASLLLRSVSSFPDYLQIERQLFNLNDLKQYVRELRDTLYFEGATDLFTARQIEQKLIKYIRG